MSAMKRMITAMLACVLLMALMSSAWAESCSVRVRRGGAVVYDASGDAVATLPQNTMLTLTGRKGKVCRISYKGKTGYMKKSDLAKVAAASAEATGNAGGNAAADYTPMNKAAYVASERAKVYNAKGKGVGKLSLNTEVTVTAVKDDVCKISVGGRKGYMKRGDLSSKKVRLLSSTAQAEADTASDSSSARPAKGTAKEMDWWKSDIQTKFPRGGTATVTDVDTGLAWKEQRRGGTNHADVQPVTAADTAAM